ncbi:hypothetical protein GXM_10111 [Nostoc sphaeroides CCNUC1]|uniref:Uncharacterized protein n=1 Tax=Nostoc sphaeroides CCNUC1 TaxID=2653204 RepID=A0A5P8WJ14_9NOSO|nr:hypothetical protein GXM_10111 [Nostoc sphaeroides CCNUC1]
MLSHSNFMRFYANIALSKPKTATQQRQQKPESDATACP